MSSLRTRLLLAALFSLCMLAGCRSAQTIYDAEYAQLSNEVAASWQFGGSTEAAINPVVQELTGPHPVETYIGYALAQNAEIQAARRRIDAMAQRVPQAASLDDPMLGVTGYPFFPAVPQTASGRMTADLMVSQEIPWHGKLGQKAAAAEAEVDAARAQLLAKQLEVVEKVKRAYYELFYVQQVIRTTEQDRKLLDDVRKILQVRVTADEATQQDLLRIQVEIARVDGELHDLRQQVASAQARLASLLHISPATPIRALDELPDEQIPRDLEQLFQQSIAVRPELHAQLAELRRDREMVELARLQYFPDITVGAGWGDMTRSGALAPTSDGIDNVSLFASMNLPIYRKRLEAGVREAEAQAVTTARHYDAMRDQMLEEVRDLFAQAVSQDALLKLMRDDIVPKAHMTYELSLRTLAVGEVDWVQLIEDWRQLLQYQLAAHRLQAQLCQTLASLERAIGGQLDRSETAEPIPPPVLEEP